MLANCSVLTGIVLEVELGSHFETFIVESEGLHRINCVKHVLGNLPTQLKWLFIRLILVDHSPHEQYNRFLDFPWVWLNDVLLRKHSEAHTYICLGGGLEPEGDGWNWQRYRSGWDVERHFEIVVYMSAAIHRGIASVVPLFVPFTYVE